MQAIKSSIITLFFVVLSHALLAEARTENHEPVVVAASAKTVETPEIKRLAHALDMSHVGKSSHHLDDPATYYHGKQKRLIRALARGGV